MKIYVSGKSGFIGSAFCRLATRQGHIIEGLAPGQKLERPPWQEIERFAPDACLHTAWITEPGVYLSSQTNNDYARWSIEFLKEMSARGVGRLVALGTCIEYAPSPAPLSETAPPNPQSAYALAKDRVRKELQSALPESSFSWARVFYPYGPGEHPRRLCSSIARSLQDSELVSLKTPDNVKDYIYIDDVASALLAIVESDRNGPINVGTGHGVAIREIAGILGELLDKPDLVTDAPEPANDDYPFVVADPTTLRSLGWSPRTDLRAGLRALLSSLP